jgi:hypothetical protein
MYAEAVVWLPDCHQFGAMQSALSSASGAVGYTHDALFGQMFDNGSIVATESVGFASVLSVSVCIN